LPKSSKIHRETGNCIEFPQIHPPDVSEKVDLIATDEGAGLSKISSGIPAQDCRWSQSVEYVRGEVHQTNNIRNFWTS